MQYIKISAKGKPQIISDLAFFEMLNDTIPSDDIKISSLIAAFDKIIRLNEEKISDNALNKVRGDYYEWLLAISGWNYFAKHDDADLILNLPNVSRFDVSKLYIEKLHSLVKDLKEKLEMENVELISSNPDFVIVDRKLAMQVVGPLSEITIVNPEIRSKVLELYKLFEHKCEYTDIKGYASAKFTLRPDRRLQIPHEGSLMKAIYTHLQTREWLIKPQGLKYYAMTTSLNDKDKKALKTVATHSITTVNSLPQRAVDEVFVVDSIHQANSAFEKMLTHRAFT